MSDNRLEDAFDSGYICAEVIIDDNGYMAADCSNDEILLESCGYKGAEASAWLDGYKAALDDYYVDEDMYKEY